MKFILLLVLAFCLHSESWENIDKQNQYYKKAIERERLKKEYQKELMSLKDEEPVWHYQLLIIFLFAFVFFLMYVIMTNKKQHVRYDLPYQDNYKIPYQEKEIYPNRFMIDYDRNRNV
jgi:hypothetical protein